jgi:hypothetical protein
MLILDYDAVDKDVSDVRKWIPVTLSTGIKRAIGEYMRVRTGVPLPMHNYEIYMVEGSRYLFILIQTHERTNIFRKFKLQGVL